MPETAHATASGPAGHAWSPAQVVRLEAEWRRLQRDFAFHPHVEVVPLSGDPPGEYHVKYRVTTLAVDATGQLAYVPEMSVHVWLPPHFPHEAPVLRPMTAAFHPNASMDWIHPTPAWRPDASLAEVVTQVGQMLAYRSYDPNGVVNPVAMKWAYDNPQLLPTDAGADPSPDAAGGPIARIALAAPDLLKGLGRRAEELCGQLASADAAPPEEEVEQFTAEARRSLELLLEPDVPDAVRGEADELEELVVSMQGAGSVWRRVARQTAVAREVESAVGRVAAAEEALSKAIADAQASPPPAPASGTEAVGPGARTGTDGVLSAVPPLTFLQPLALTLGGAVRQADAAVAELRNGLQRLGPVQRPPGLVPGRLLSRLIEKESARLATAAEPARASGAALASLEPVLDRARTDAAAVERLVTWAEYLDLTRQGEDLVRRLAAIDSAGLQAYRVVVGETTHGPFEFELRVEAAGISLAVSNPRGATVRVIDGNTEELIATGDGVVTVTARAPFAVQPTEHTDDLRVQLEYLLTQAREVVVRIAPDTKADGDARAGAGANPEGEPWAADFWAGRLVGDLSDSRVRAAVRHDHRAATQRWKALLADLAALGRFKQRMATHHLLSRLVHFVPPAKQRVRTLGELIARCETRLSEIAARAPGAAATGEPIIPQHLAGEYADRLAERDGARQELARLERSLEAAARRARARLSKPRLYGSRELPAFRVLPALPNAYLELQPSLSDVATEAMVDRLETLLETKLRDGAGTAATRPEAS